tara:strand:- start:430 stop:942 length:513 start_codon:yes stop_codon:yes gene_type:complete
MSKEILIPTAWEDVTLSEFIELSKLDIDSFDTPIEYYIRMLGIFGNDDLNNILEFVKLTDIKDIINQMAFMNTPPRNLDNKEVTIKGEVFRLIENMNELTVGEYISIETLIEQGKLDSISSIPAILSVILKPVGEEFDSNLVNARMELFKNELSIEDVLGMSVFFSIGVK